MRNLVLVIVMGCGAKVGAYDTQTLPHPSATDSVAANEIQFDESSRYVSLTKATQDEICIDVWTRMTEISPEKAIAGVTFQFKADEVVGTCVGVSSLSDAWCDHTEPFPKSRVTTFRPVVVEVKPARVPTEQFVMTGNRETVCVEELHDRRGDRIGCKRYVQRDEARRVHVDGYVYTARGGTRTCFPNAGRIGPTSSSFAFSYARKPMRFDFTGGKAVAAWGGTGGTPAESQPLANIPEQATVQGTDEGAAPPAPARPAETAPATKAAKQDPLLARADPAFATPATTITNGGRVVVEVDAKGVMTWAKGELGTWKGGALIAKGRVALVVTASGEVLSASGRSSSRFDGDRLVFENGTTFAIDKSRRIRATERNGTAVVSKATVQTTKTGRRLALLMASLQAGQLGFAPTK
ncbi:MAG TPA: hypothetical protein VIU61_00935 [Kofleriaceae bacterium]